MNLCGIYKLNEWKDVTQVYTTLNRADRKGVKQGNTRLFEISPYGGDPECMHRFGEIALKASNIFCADLQVESEYKGLQLACAKQALSCIKEYEALIFQDAFKKIAIKNISNPTVLISAIIECAKWVLALGHYAYVNQMERAVTEARHLYVQNKPSIEGRLEKNLNFAKAQQEVEDRKYFNPSGKKLDHPNESILLNRVGQHVVVASSIGNRPHMEDAHTVEQFELKAGGKTHDVHLYGVFDGHRGDHAAIFSRDSLSRHLQLLLEKHAKNGLTDEVIYKATKEAFVALDKAFPEEIPGTTAAVAFILGGKLWIANVGDSRVCLINEGKVIQLSEDAKPEIPRFDSSVIKKGGFFQFTGTVRVNGALATSRAIGDHDLGVLSPKPKITAIPLEDIQDGARLAIGSDGLFDQASTNELGEFILSAELEPEDIVVNTLNEVLDLPGDNVTFMLIDLNIN